MVRFQYVHLRRRRNPVTVAYTIHGDGENGVYINFAASFCAEGDSFHRKIGRAIAEGRLRKTAIMLPIVISGDESLNQAIVRSIETNIRRHSFSVMGILCAPRRKQIEMDNDILVIQEIPGHSVGDSDYESPVIR